MIYVIMNMKINFIGGEDMFIEDIKNYLKGEHILSKSMALSLNDWEEKGRPSVWCKVACAPKEQIELWTDTGYGRLALYNEATGEVALGRDFVSLKGYVGLSEYYTSDRPRLYKEI